MARVQYTVTFWVMDSNGNVVDNYGSQRKAVEHAAKIGGTWRRGRY